MVTESKLDKQDTKMIYSVLEKPRNIKFVLRSFSQELGEDDREVNVSLRNNGVLTFSYNMELYDFTEKLVDILDTLRLKFKAEEERNINTVNIVVQL